MYLWLTRESTLTVAIFSSTVTVTMLFLIILLIPSLPNMSVNISRRHSWTWDLSTNRGGGTPIKWKKNHIPKLFQDWSIFIKDFIKILSIGLNNFLYSSWQFNIDKTNKLSLEFTWKMDTKNLLFCGMGSLSALSTTVTTASAYMSVTGLAIHWKKKVL